MNPYTLIIDDPQIQEAYKQRRHILRYTIINYYYLMTFSTMIFILILHYGYEFFKVSVAQAAIFTMCCCLVFYLLGNCYPKAAQVLFIIHNVCLVATDFGAFYYFLLRQDCQDDNSGQQLFLYMNQCASILFYMILLTSVFLFTCQLIVIDQWILRILFLCAVELFFFGTSQFQWWFILLSFFLVLLFFGFIEYEIEKISKSEFLEAYNNENLARNLLKIFEDDIPCSVAILQKNKNKTTDLVFYNTHFRERLRSNLPHIEAQQLLQERPENVYLRALKSVFVKPSQSEIQVDASRVPQQTATQNLSHHNTSNIQQIQNPNNNNTFQMSRLNLIRASTPKQQHTIEIPAIEVSKALDEILEQRLEELPEVGVREIFHDCLLIPQQQQQNSSMPNVGQQLQHFNNNDSVICPQMQSPGRIVPASVQSLQRQTTVPQQQQSRAQYFDITIAQCNLRGKASLLVVMNDISEQKQAIAVNKANNFKQEVLAAITNDLKTPLHNLLTHLELAESSNDLAQIKLFADIAARSGQMLLHNVNDFIDYSYFIKNGLFNLCKRYFLLRHFIADFQHIFQHQAQVKGLNFQISPLSEELQNLCLRTDSVRLMQVLINVAAHALKCTNSGTLSLSVELLPLVQRNISLRQHVQIYSAPALQQTSQQTNKPQLILFELQTSGDSIQETERKRIFDFQGDTLSQGSQQHQLALGLTVACKIAGALGPREAIHVENLSGGRFSYQFVVYVNLMRRRTQQSSSPENISNYGSENFRSQIIFEDEERHGPVAASAINQEESAQAISSIESEVYIEQVRAENYSHNPATRIAQTPPPRERFVTFSHSQKIVLVVEEEPYSQLAITNTIISKFPEYRVENAYSGHEAIRKVRLSLANGAPYSFIIMESEMPVMSGLQTCEVLAGLMQDHPLYKLQIILCCARNSKRNAEKFSTLGCVQLLEKPINQLKLMRVIRQIERHQQNQVQPLQNNNIALQVL